MKLIIQILTVVSLCNFIACNTKKDGTYANGQNPAEHAEEPGDKDRKNSETNEEAKKRGIKDGDTRSVNDKTFLQEAADAGLIEVKLGELAQQKGETPVIRNFGKSMIDDHSKANSELKILAAQKNIVIKNELCGACQEKVKELSKLAGSSFDKRYAEMMVTDHQEVVAKFAAEAEAGVDNDIKTWASQKLPVLKHHLSMAEAINKK